MIDIKPFIAEQLSPIGAVELSYSGNFRVLPLIVMTETGNEAEVVIQNTDCVSRITVQLDIYAETAAETERIAVDVNRAMTSKGFRRSFSKAIYDEDKPRRCMRFTCGIDEAAGRILTIN